MIERLAKEKPRQMLMFSLSGETVGLDANLVRGILDPVPVTRVPGARSFVGGVINVRGNVVPLADLRPLLGMEAGTATIDTRFVVIEIDLDGDQTTVGLVAEKVFEVTEIAADALLDKPNIGIHWPPEFIRTVGKWKGDVFVVPDMNRIFN
jgi:purine-binding chemotaxis protein CheW